LQTGGLEFGDISTRSRPASVAISRALSEVTNPSFSPSAPIKRISSLSIVSFTLGPLLRAGAGAF
tara:strand:+ start:590 stop:784 length:195 start_codon:yes stop_codon:yes gene_type:complete